MLLYIIYILLLQVLHLLHHHYGQVHQGDSSLCLITAMIYLLHFWLNLLSAGWKFYIQETKTREGLCKDHDTVGPIVNCTDPRWKIKKMY